MSLSPTPFTGIYVESNWQRGIKDPFQRHLYYANVCRALQKISTYTLGKELLDLIAKRNAGIGTSASGVERSVTIRPNAPGKEGASAFAWKEEQKFHRTIKLKGGGTMMGAGKGSRSILYVPCDDKSDAMFTKLAGVNTPTWLALAHELIHAYHQLSGTSYKEEVTAPGGGVKREEMVTTGLGVYKNTRLSENAIRREAGLPPRNHYTFPDDYTHIKALSKTPDVHALQHHWKCGVLQQLEESFL
jgi:hypothetical protein